MHTMVLGTSAFKGIYAVRPGHMVIIKKHTERDYGMHGEAHIGQIREQLIESVRLCLIADVPVGCYLSGGIE